MYNVDKEQLLNDFFRSLRGTLTNSFSYPKNHPYFIKSVENFKSKLDALLAVVNPLKIGITSSGVMVDGKNLDKAVFFEDLAHLLHRRKIKSIEIRPGVTLRDLMSLFSVISLQQEVIAKGGGVNVLLAKQPLFNLTIEELDYSMFLREGGQECADIWSYLLKEAVQSNDETKINSLADNFGILIQRSGQNEIFQAPEIPAAINEFLIYLKNKDQEKFAKCSKDIFLWLLHNKNSIGPEKLDKLQQIFDSLSQEDLSNLFWEGLAQEDNFDDLSLQFFAKITGPKDPGPIVQGVVNKINAEESLRGNSRAAKRIQDLLTSPQTGQVSAVYRNTLESLVKGISFSGVLFFDQKELRRNYHYIILNIILTNEDKNNLLLAEEVLENELAGIFEDNDFDFLKDLSSQLIKKKRQGLEVCADLEKKLSAFIENIILNQALLPEQECLLGIVSLPSQDASVYLNIIFGGQQANQYVLGLFFKFFPGNLDLFYQRVEQRLHDIEFIFSLIKALGQLTAQVTSGILDHLYSSGNELIKAEVLRTMQQLKKVNVEFLVRQLNTDSPLLRKSVFSVLMNARIGDGALDLLLKIPNFFGTRNTLLIENMQIVFDLGLIEAAGRIRDLSRRRFFWNRKLRDKAKQILKEWNVR